MAISESNASSERRASFESSIPNDPMMVGMECIALLRPLKNAPAPAPACPMNEPFKRAFLSDIRDFVIKTGAVVYETNPSTSELLVIGTKDDGKYGLIISGSRFYLVHGLESNRPTCAEDLRDYYLGEMADLPELISAVKAIRDPGWGPLGLLESV